MNLSKFLLPRYFKIVGLSLLLISLILAIDRFYFGHKYHILKFKVFSFYSEFLFTRKFSFTRNNQGEEIVAIFAIIGFALIAFSKELIENEFVNSLRIKALVISFALNITFSVLGTLFLHGLGYFYFLSILLFTPMASYYFSFKLFYWKNLKLIIRK